MHDPFKTTCDFLTSAMPTRRQVLQVGLAASALFLAPWNAWAKVGKMITELPERTVNLYNVNTGELLSRFIYWQDGNYIKEALDEISYLLRDHRTDEVKEIDPLVIDQICALGSTFEAFQPFEIISGYRSEETNKELRHRSRRVAKHSLHIEGRAIDLRLPGVSTKQLRAAALSLHNGGVGYYPKRSFVHIDSGPIRHW
ncbi:MAG: DUF882 domain-containing protein [Desulfuromonadales bacterium]|nr:DUF882 domain-containing protein [Desulfuromonadales bacterium]